MTIEMDAIEKSICAAQASLEMEGFTVDERSITLCREMLNGKISMEDYIAFVSPLHNVKEAEGEAPQMQT